MGSCCRLVVRPDINIMLRAALVLLAILCLTLAEPQNNNRFRNNNRNNRNNRNRPARQNRQNNQFGRNGVTRNGARDAKGTEVYPGCNGKVCLPDARLCAERKQKAGHQANRGKSYWFSWNSDEAVLRNARWNWFTARNYCRKRCMDLISIESRAEQDFIGREMKRAGVREIWSSGRLSTRRLTDVSSQDSSPTTSED